MVSCYKILPYLIVKLRHLDIKFALIVLETLYTEITISCSSSILSFVDFKVPHKESDAVKPWTKIAKYKLQVESELKNIPGLNFTVVRPAIVYGVGDKTGLSKLGFKLCKMALE